MKKVAISVAIAVLLLIMGLVAGARFINSDGFQGWVVIKLNQAIAGRIVVGKAEISLLRGRLRLDGVRILDPDQTELLSLDHGDLSLSWAALLKREIRVTALVVAGVRLNLLYDDQDRLLLASVFTQSDDRSSSQKPSRSGWSLRVDDFNLSSGVIHIQRPVKDFKAEIGPLAMGGRMDLAGPIGALDTSLDRVHLVGPGFDQILSNIRIKATYRGADARPWHVDLKTSTSHVSVRGQLQPDGVHTELDVEGLVDLDLAEVQAWIPRDLGLAGRLKAKLAVVGTVADPGVSLDLEISPVALLGMEGSQVSARVGLEQRLISIAELSGTGPWGRLDLGGKLDLQSIFPRNFFEKSAGLASLAYDVTVTAADLQPGKLPDLPLAWSGTWQGRSHLQGRGLPGLAVNQGQGEGAFTVSRIRLAPGGQPVAGDVSVRFHWDRSLVEVPECRAHIPEHVLEAQGRIDLGQRQLQATGRLTSEQVAVFGEALGIGLPRGQAVVNLTAQGPLSRPRATANLLAQAVEISSWHLGRVLVTAELDSELNLRFPRLVLENQGSYLEGSGHIALAEADPSLGLDLLFDHMDPSDFKDLGQVGAFCNGQLVLEGTFKNLSGKVTLDPSPVAWGRYGAQAQGVVLWHQGRLSIPELQLIQGDSRVELNGEVAWLDPGAGQWRADPLLKVKARVQTLNLEDIWPGYQGEVVATAEVAGTLANPVGRFTLDGQQLDLKYQDIQKAHLAGRLEDRVVYVERLSMGLDAHHGVNGTGWYALDRRFQFQLTAEDLDLAQIRAIQGAYPVHGRLDAKVVGSGSLEQPLIRSEVTVRDPRLRNQALDDFRMSAALEGSRLWVDGEMNFDIKADCDVASGEFVLNTVFDQSDLSHLLTLLGGAGWQGQLSGKIVASGNWHAWQQVRGLADLRGVELLFNQQRLVSVPELRLNLQDGMLELPESRLLILEDGYLTVAARSDAAQNVDLKADGAIPVAALAPFLKDAEDLSGEVRLAAVAQGPWDRIRWQLDADLEKVGYVLPYLSQTLHDVNGRVLITPTDVTLSGVSGMLDQGHFSMDGHIRMEDFQPIDGIVTLNLDQLPLQVPDTLDLALNGRLTLTGTPNAALLEGKLILLEGTYYKDLKLNLWSLVTQTKRGQTVPQTIQRPQWMENITLQVGLSHRYPFLVDNNVARLEIVPDLKLTGTLARPLLNGRATVTEGEVTFRGKIFPVTRGVVDFLNPHKIEPSLDILSEAQIRQWLVSLSVSGTLDQLLVKLDSDPPEAENDIVSLILFGRTNAELTTGRGGGGATTQQMLAGLLASALGEDVKKTTGVDILEVDTGAKAEDDSADRIQVTVGKNLTPRITVKYVVESNNGEMIQRAVSEYRFTEQLIASGFQDSKGRYGGEMLFRLEFR